MAEVISKLLSLSPPARFFYNTGKDEDGNTVYALADAMDEIVQAKLLGVLKGKAPTP